MNEWEDDPDQPKPPWNGERVAFLIVVVLVFLLVTYSSQ